MLLMKENALLHIILAVLIIIALLPFAWKIEGNGVTGTKILKIRCSNNHPSKAPPPAFYSLKLETSSSAMNNVIKIQRKLARHNSTLIELNRVILINFHEDETAEWTLRELICRMEIIQNDNVTVEFFQLLKEEVFGP